MKRTLFALAVLATLSVPSFAAGNSTPNLTPAEQAKYSKLTTNDERRKFMATRDYLKKNKGRNAASTAPKPMPDEVEFQFALDEKEMNFLLEVAMNEAI